jgi:hypothetical protein
MELVSSKPRQLNSTMLAIYLDLILPYIVDTLERYSIDLENQLAIIQREYTFSVYWKFRNEAQNIFKQTPLIRIIYLKKLFSKKCIHCMVRLTKASEHRNVKEDLKPNWNVLSTFENL